MTTTIRRSRRPLKPGRAAGPISGTVALDPRVDAESVRPHLLATDLSIGCEPAAAEAIRLAGAAGAQLIILNVIDPSRLRLPDGGFLRRVDQERSRIETGVRALVGRAQATGTGATFLVWEGDPADGILAASEAEDVDIIVLGSRPRGPGGPLLGSTCLEVRERATRRVLVIAG